MYSVRGTAALPAVGFPIRTSSDQSLVSGSPGLFAATHVLLRLLSPRHPSCALCSLVIFSLLVSPSSLPRSKTRVQRGVVNRRTFPTTHLAYLRICSFQRTTFKNRSKSWWSRSGSNRRHPACKAGALPAELRPRYRKGDTKRAAAGPLHHVPDKDIIPRLLVGLDRFELSTPRLSSVCSNQLSYRPNPGQKRPKNFQRTGVLRPVSQN